jgi:hypothetical protein
MAFPMNKLSMIAALGLSIACTPGAGEDDDATTSATSEASTSTTDDPTGATTVEPTAGTVDTDPTASTLDGTTDSSACTLPPLEQEVLDFLSIAAPGFNTFVPAGDTQLSLVWIEFGTPMSVDACVEWSIAPVDGVAIDDSGRLTVDASVPAGTTISVTADVEAGRRILMADFEVYVPVTYDIIGFWTEVEQLACDSGLAFDPEPIIGELVFENTGEFSVTWTPFEVYFDYWGTYTYDEGTGALVLSVDGGNYVPPDIDGEGTAMVMGGQLVLQDMWLGTAQEPVTPVACGHVFE